MCTTSHHHPWVSLYVCVYVKLFKTCHVWIYLELKINNLQRRWWWRKFLIEFGREKRRRSEKGRWWLWRDDDDDYANAFFRQRVLSGFNLHSLTIITIIMILLLLFPIYIYSLSHAILSCVIMVMEISKWESFLA